MKLSVIVPCYKRINQTKKTLKLLLTSQGWGRDFEAELIVVDSTPNETLKKALAPFEGKIKYIKPKKRGISTNKNAGARIAKGEILVFCDSDIEVEKDTLLNTAVALKVHPQAAMIMGKVIWWGGERDGECDRPSKHDRILKYKGTSFVEAIYGRFMTTYKKIFWKVGGFDEALFNMRGEGSDLSIRYWRSGFPLVFEPKIKVFHVFGAPEAITRGIPHPERGPIRDLIILGLKYGLFGKEGNFATTLGWLKDKFGNRDKYVIMENVIELLPCFTKNWQKIKRARKKALKPKYDFKFLEVFSQRELFRECVDSYEKIKDCPSFASLDCSPA